MLGPVRRVHQRLGLGCQPCVRGVQQERPQPHADLRGAGLVRRDDVIALLPQPDGEQPGLGGLARALAALEREEQPGPAGRLTGCRARGRHRFLPTSPEDCHQVLHQRDSLAVIHLLVGGPAQQQRDDGGQQQDQVVADVAIVEAADPQIGGTAGADQRVERARQYRRDRDHGEQDHPDRRLQERERAAPGVVVDLKADHGVAGHVRNTGAGADHDHQDDRHHEVRDQGGRRERQRGEHDRHAEQPPPGEPVQHGQAQEHADGQAEEDGRERRAPPGAAALENVGDVGGPQADDGPAGGERAGHAQHDAAQQLAPAEELPAVPDRFQYRGRGDLVGRAPAQFLQHVDGQRRDQVHRCPEVQREVDLVSREIVRDVPERGAQDRQQREEQSGDRRRAVGGEQAELVGLLQLVARDQVRYRGVLGRQPEQRCARGQELDHVDPGQLVDHADGQVDRDRDVQRRPDDVADDHVHPAVEFVGHRSRQRPEDQPGQQRGQPDPADRVGAVLRAADLGRQRRERQQAQPVPEAGQRERDPQAAERRDRQHASATAAQRGSKVHCARV